jgi:hypothetical protein
LSSRHLFIWSSGHLVIWSARFCDQIASINTE